jgi:hypothetical protein
MRDPEIIPGETALAIDALPGEAGPAETIAIINDVRQESLAAVMAQGDLPRTRFIRGYGHDLPPRPTSGPLRSDGRRERG